MKRVCKLNFPVDSVKIDVSFLRPTGVKLTLSGLIDGKNINAGGHKLGLGLELEA